MVNNLAEHEIIDWGVELIKIQEPEFDEEVNNHDSFHVTLKTTNTVTGQVYIGYHRVPLTRLETDNYLGSGKKLLEDIKIYGRESFKREILCAFIRKADGLEHEAFLVTAKVANDPLYYNILAGGSMTAGVTKLPEYWKESMRKPKSEEHRQHMRKPKTLKHRENISKGRLGKIYINNGMKSLFVTPFEFMNKWMPLGYVKGRLAA